MKLEKTTMNGQKFLSVLSAGLAVVFGLGAAVEATSHSGGWTFGNLGTSSYRLKVFEPDEAGLWATLGVQDPTVTLQKLCSIVDKEIVHGQDDEEEKDFKSKETNNLCLFNLWEGHEDPFPPLFAC